MIISLGCRSPDISSNLPGNIGRAALKRLPIWSCTGWGLPCPSCHHEGGELLPHRFTLTMTSMAVCFLWHFPRGHPQFALRTILPCGVRTFLPGYKPERSCAHSKTINTSMCMNASIYCKRAGFKICPVKNSGAVNRIRKNGGKFTGDMYPYSPHTCILHS